MKNRVVFRPPDEVRAPSDNVDGAPEGTATNQEYTPVEAAPQRLAPGLLSVAIARCTPVDLLVEALRHRSRLPLAPLPQQLQRRIAACWARGAPC